MTSIEKALDTMSHTFKFVPASQRDLFVSEMERHLTTLLAEAVKEERERHAETLEALALMWNQYCSGNEGHMFMSAGESASTILGERYGILTPVEGKQINDMYGNAEVKYPIGVGEKYLDFFIDALSKR